jgi:DNA polymerase epsilon subunit 1
MLFNSTFMRCLFSQIAWICQDCECPFNKDFIEWRLVCFIQRRSVQYQLQDLRCTKTQAVAKQNLSKQSQTSAPLKQDVSHADIALQLHTLRTLAEFHELEWLYEVVENLMVD